MDQVLYTDFTGISWEIDDEEETTDAYQLEEAEINPFGYVLKVGLTLPLQ